MRKWFICLTFVMLVDTAQAQKESDFQNGVVAYSNGQYEQAVGFFESALKYYSSIKKKKSVAADCYNYLGLLYQVLNQHGKAVENFKAAVPLFIETKNKSGAASALGNWGISSYRLKLAELRQNKQSFSLEDIGSLMAYHLKAKQYHEELKDKTGVANDLNNIATMYFEGEFYDEASDYLNQALKIHSEIGYKAGMAYDMANLARLYYKTDDEAGALKFYQRSVGILEEIGDREGAWRTYSYIGSIYESFMKQAAILKDAQKESENRKSAIVALKKSVEIIESFRGNFTNKDFFDSYLKDKNPVYKRLIRLLKLDDNAAEALYYIERSKAKMSNDVLSSGKLAFNNKEEQKQVDKVQDLQKKTEELEKKIADEKAKPADKQDKARIDSLSKSLTKNQGDFNALMIDLETKYPNIYQVIKVDPIQLSDIQKQLSDDVVILEYFPADDALYIFMITKDKIEAKSVPVSSTTIDSLVNKYRYYINDVTSLMKRGRFDTKLANWKQGEDSRFYERHTKPLRDIMVKLNDYLILPVWETIKDAKYKNVTIIPAASLYYVPFQCLATETQDGDISFLVEKKAVNYLTAATLMDIINKKKQNKINNVLVFGNPDGSLPGAEEEAKIIKAAYTDALLYKNQDATKDKAKDLSGNTEVVHFATHGFLSSDEPQKSFLLMAPNKAKNEDDKLTISEILKMPLKEKNELVVLSACNTSMGKSATGVELISLSRAFAIAGAPTTVATLWPVDDESTKIIMVNFYDGLKKGLAKSEAMRQAQIALIRKGDYHIHPFFWAPYVMIGNPK
ncbi:CHAT domain-containing protein [bacterium]|nr:CHAT domain-containing protein [bacterium]NUN44816.1 CHAT domain-containing protein [bacterium]